MAGYRVGRVSEDIKREIVAVIRELKDPRVRDKFLTVVRVDVSSDLSFAKVYVSSMSGIEDAKEAVKGLTSATGLIRREVGSKLHLRKTPELKFIADDSVQHGMEIFKKIESTVITDVNDDEDAE
jgi:ribosome-binding factor A